MTSAGQRRFARVKWNACVAPGDSDPIRNWHCLCRNSASHPRECAHARYSTHRSGAVKPDECDSSAEFLGGSCGGVSPRCFASSVLVRAVMKAQWQMPHTVSAAAFRALTIYARPAPSGHFENAAWQLSGVLGESSLFDQVIGIKLDAPHKTRYPTVQNPMVNGTKIDARGLHH